MVGVVAGIEVNQTNDINIVGEGGVIRKFDRVDKVDEVDEIKKTDEI